MAVFGKVYSYPNNPRVARMKIIAELNGLELEAPPYEHGVTNKTPEFLAKFPLGKIPVFEGSDGFLLAESSAIDRYLIESGPQAEQLLGKELKERALITQWTFFAEAEFFNNALDAIGILGLRVIPYDEQRVNASLDKVTRSVRSLEKALEGGKKYLVGDSYTLADISVVSWLYITFKTLIDAEMRKGLPNLVAYVQAFADVPLHKRHFGELELDRPSELDRLHESAIRRHYWRMKVVAVYIAGEALGALCQIIIGDRLGRKRFMQLACIVVTIGVVIQTAAVNMEMLLAGRVVAGIAVGSLSGTVPIYLSEISPPQSRGLIGGLGGVGLSLGTMTANWIGFAGSFAPYGPVQWRLPLALQAPWGVVLFCCLATYMPHSPRQLIQRGRVEEARVEFGKTADGMSAHEVEEEFAMMKARIGYEKSREIPSYPEIWRLYRRRVLVSISVQVLTSVTGINVIQYYQTSTYESLGMDPRTILALAAAWGTCAFASNVISVLYLPDRWGRRKMLLAGVGCVIATEIYSAVLQRIFQHTDNRVGKGFAILGIYLFVVCYYGLINSTTWLYGSEVLPIAIRSKIVGVSATAHYIVNVALTQAGPTAFAAIQENYYYVFVGVCTIYLVLIHRYFPETKQKTLEEIAAAFGDRVVDVDDQDNPSKLVGHKGGIDASAEHQEERSNGSR
ncbi:hypothetical protein F5Y17DRAFT_456521 [Xylariaceae sp. FL0594]|nr:hypothetical protein F5Y17DRAFT_456521 [Xylariaceae sp. FL0594]